MMVKNANADAEQSKPSGRAWVVGPVAKATFFEQSLLFSLLVYLIKILMNIIILLTEPKTPKPHSND